MTENELKREVTQLAYRNGWAVYHLPQAKPRRPVRTQGQSTAVGYPDLTLARDGEVLWLELKQQAESPSTAQLAWAQALGRSWHLIRPSDLASGRVGELLR